MRTVLILIGVLASACLGLFAQIPPVSPHATRMDPKVAKPGTIVTITGVALDKGNVEEVYLTDHRFDMKVKVLEQSAESLKIRVPPFAKAGRQQLLILTAGNRPAYLEQPVYITVELDEEPAKSENPKPAAKDQPAPAAGDKANNPPERQD